MALVGFEPANLGTKGQHATSRPPKLPNGYSVFDSCDFDLHDVLLEHIPCIKLNLSVFAQQTYLTATTILKSSECEER